MPLLPAFAISQSSVSSKLPNSSLVMMSPPAAPLAASDDQNGIVTSDGADDLAPPGAVERQAQRLRGSRRRLQHEQRADALGGNEHRGQQLLQVWADTRRAFRRRRIVRAPVRRRDLREA